MLQNEQDKIDDSRKSSDADEQQKALHLQDWRRFHLALMVVMALPLRWL